MCLEHMVREVWERVWCKSAKALARCRWECRWWRRWGQLSSSCGGSCCCVDVLCWELLMLLTHLLLQAVLFAFRAGGCGCWCCVWRHHEWMLDAGVREC